MQALGERHQLVGDGVLLLLQLRREVVDQPGQVAHVVAERVAVVGGGHARVDRRGLGAQLTRQGDAVDQPQQRLAGGRGRPPGEAGAEAMGYAFEGRLAGEGGLELGQAAALAGGQVELGDEQRQNRALLLGRETGRGVGRGHDPSSVR